MALQSLRHYIDLIEDVQAGPWGITKTALFDETFSSMLTKVPDLRERLKKFIEVKSPNPMMNRYGKNDGPFTHSQLRGILHCHLAPDAILLYRLLNRTIQLMMVCQHADIEGRRLKQTIRRLAA